MRSAVGLRHWLRLQTKRSLVRVRTPLFSINPSSLDIRCCRPPFHHNNHTSPTTLSIQNHAHSNSLISAE